MPMRHRKPTEAGTEMNSPEAQSASTPPISAKGTLQNTSVACRTEPKVR